MKRGVEEWNEIAENYTILKIIEIIGNEDKTKITGQIPVAAITIEKEFIKKSMS